MKRENTEIRNTTIRKLFPTSEITERSNKTVCALWRLKLRPTVGPANTSDTRWRQNVETSSKPVQQLQIETP
jgi:hypothetical protein